MKDQSTTTPSQSEAKTDQKGDSFLTGKDQDPAKTPDPAKGPEPKDGEKKSDEVVGAPEKYADFKLPEGFKFDDKQLTDAQTLFKSLNLPQEGAQKLVDLYTANISAAVKAPYDAWANLQKEWTTEISSRFGDKTDTVRTNISKAVDTVLPPSLAKNFRSALDLTGAGSHPDIVEALSILFRPHYEGTPVRGNGPSRESQNAPGAGERPSAAMALYGHLAKDRQ